MEPFSLWPSDLSLPTRRRRGPVEERRAVPPRRPSPPRPFRSPRRARASSSAAEISWIPHECATHFRGIPFRNSCLISAQGTAGRRRRGRGSPGRSAAPDEEGGPGVGAWRRGEKYLVLSIHTDTHTLAYMYRNTLKLTQTHTNTPKHTHPHTHTNTHIQTSTHRCTVLRMSSLFYKLIFTCAARNEQRRR